MPAPQLTRFAILPLALAACALAAPGQHRAATFPSAVAGLPLAPTGYVTGDTAVVRRTPRSRSPAVGALVGNSRDEPIDLLGLSGDYVHVRRGSVEGWARTADVLPCSVAVVFDARTGATVAVVPVGSTQRHIVFSPDGASAVVYGSVADGPPGAWEFRTSDFATTRSITAKGAGGDPVQIIGVFYGGPDRSMYAVVNDDQAPEESRLAILHVGEPGAAAEPPAWHGAGSDFIASTDGRVGFVTRFVAYDSNLRPRSASVDVVDLRSLSVRNSIALSGDLARAFVSPEPSVDGSELYLLGDVSRLRVVDTATGAETRQVQTGWAENPELVLENYCSGGRSLMLVALGNPCEITIPDGAWSVTGSARTPAPTAACALDMGTARYGTDGSRLLRVGPSGTLTQMGLLPKLLEPPPGQTIWSWSMAANPDGSRIVLFVSFAEEFCPC